MLHPKKQTSTAVACTCSTQRNKHQLLWLARAPPKETNINCCGLHMQQPKKQTSTSVACTCSSQRNKHQLLFACTCSSQRNKHQLLLLARAAAKETNINSCCLHVHQPKAETMKHRTTVELARASAKETNSELSGACPSMQHVPSVRTGIRGSGCRPSVQHLKKLASTFAISLHFLQPKFSIFHSCYLHVHQTLSETMKHEQRNWYCQQCLCVIIACLSMQYHHQSSGRIRGLVQAVLLIST